MATKQILDATLNDSDKSFAVPVGHRQEFFYGSVLLVTTATAGNRQFAFEIQDDSANVVFQAFAGVTQAASLSYRYNIGPDVPRETALIGGQLFLPVPKNIILLPGWSIRAYDQAAIDAAADDMTVNLIIDERDIKRFDPQAG